MSVVLQPLRDNVNLNTLVMYTFPVVAAKFVKTFTQPMFWVQQIYAKLRQLQIANSRENSTNA